jgi:ribosome-binding protein aMBF1 (putative translation factor)
MTQPGWFCERCGVPVPEIPTDAELPESGKLRCPHCKKHTVIWLIPPPPQQVLSRKERQQTNQESIEPRRPRFDAKHLFDQMRQIVNDAPDQTGSDQP